MDLNLIFTGAQIICYDINPVFRFVVQKRAQVFLEIRLNGLLRLFCC